MKLFINAGWCGRKWNGNLKIKEILDKKQLCLSIPNYLEKEHRQEKIKFYFDLDKITEKSLEQDVLLENISLKRTSKNSYHITSSKKTTERCIYALIRSTKEVPDDVFIPASMKDKVEVIRRCRFIDDEVDYGDFLSNVYLIKISLNLNETLPVYLTRKDSELLTNHYVFFRVEDYSARPNYKVSSKLETFIYINKNNKDEYVALSKLL